MKLDLNCATSQPAAAELILILLFAETSHYLPNLHFLEHFCKNLPSLSIRYCFLLRLSDQGMGCHAIVKMCDACLNLNDILKGDISTYEDTNTCELKIEGPLKVWGHKLLSTLKSSSSVSWWRGRGAMLEFSHLLLPGSQSKQASDSSWGRFCSLFSPSPTPTSSSHVWTCLASYSSAISSMHLASQTVETFIA